MRVAVLGASPNKSRFSNQAMHLLRQYGHEVIPVNPGHRDIEGLTTVAHVNEADSPIDTVTVYISPRHIEPLISDILEVKPRRVIVNPGAESKTLEKAVREAGIDYVEDCTLVMLRGGYF